MRTPDRCPLCQAFYEKYPLTDDGEGGQEHVFERNEDGTAAHCSASIECAFPNGVFSPDNWCCETMYLLRQSLFNDRFVRVWHEDENVGVIPIPLPPDHLWDEVQHGFLVMSWYKSRGRTGQAMIFLDANEPEPLTLKTAQFLIESYHLSDE